jgi:predicted TIM-barrel fold metal-dependent hydrolase
MIVDSHVHIWRIDPAKYPIGPTSPNWSSFPDEEGTAEELLEEMDVHGIDRTVLIQCSWSTWDNGYIADCVAQNPGRFVGQGLVDPQDPDNAEKARYWVARRGLAGFRFHPIYYPNEKILIEDRNQPLWREIADLGAVVQLHLRPQFADQAEFLAQQYPTMPIIIDHMGYPQVEDGEAAYQPIINLSRYENVHVKLSDIARRSHEKFPYRDVHPFIQMILLNFGSERMMWGTGYPGHHRLKNDWPSLAQELRLIREGLPFMTEIDETQLLGATACRVWGLT